MHNSEYLRANLQQGFGDLAQAVGEYSIAGEIDGADAGGKLTELHAVLEQMIYGENKWPAELRHLSVAIDEVINKFEGETRKLGAVEDVEDPEVVERMLHDLDIADALIKQARARQRDMLALLRSALAQAQIIAEQAIKP